MNLLFQKKKKNSFSAGFIIPVEKWFSLEMRCQALAQAQVVEQGLEKSGRHHAPAELPMTAPLRA